MVNRKKVQKIVGKYAQDSFANGRLDPKKVLFYSQEFKKVPGNEAIVYLMEYIKAVKTLEDKSTLYIESASPLTPAQKARVVKSLKDDFQINKIVSKIDPSVLGGVRVKIGDHIYEDTVKSRIESIGDFING